MKTFALSAAFALVAALANAAPSARQFEVQLTFEGAGPNPPTYTLSEPADGSVFTIGTYIFCSLTVSIPSGFSPFKSTHTLKSQFGERH